MLLIFIGIFFEHKANIGQKVHLQKDTNKKHDLFLMVREKTRIRPVKGLYVNKLGLKVFHYMLT